MRPGPRIKLAAFCALGLTASTTPVVWAADQSWPSAVVLACVGKDGQLLSTEIIESSKSAEIDEAALKVAHESKFTPAMVNGKSKRRSCVKLKVKFAVVDGELVVAGS